MLQTYSIIALLVERKVLKYTRERATKEFSMSMRVFVLRTHFGSKLLILFKRVDKTAVELFIVLGIRENSIHVSTKANKYPDYCVALLFFFHLVLSLLHIFFSMFLLFLV